MLQKALTLIFGSKHERDIRKILGENFLRVFAEAERVARAESKNISGDGSTRRIK